VWKGKETKQNKTKQELWKQKESISEDTAMEIEKNFFVTAEEI